MTRTASGKRNDQILASRNVGYSIVSFFVVKHYDFFRMVPLKRPRNICIISEISQVPWSSWPSWSLSTNATFDTLACGLVGAVASDEAAKLHPN